MSEAGGADSAQLRDGSIELLERVRQLRPHVHVLTNPVAMTRSADALCALGARPSMTVEPRRVAEFVRAAGALVVNLGMLDDARERAILRAVEAARRFGRPWLLDPVKVEVSGHRRSFAERLLDAGPAVIRLNAAEFAALGGGDPPAFAAHRGIVVTLTGAVDVIADGSRSAQIANGSPLLERLTATGCTLSALLGAFLAVTSDAFAAATAAVLTFDVAAECAAEQADGPGTLAARLVDALYRLDGRTLEARARLS